jgi:hypothetical protein
VPSFRACLRVMLGLSALAGAFVPTALLAQSASDFDPTLDSGSSTAPTFQKQTKPASDQPTRFGDVPGSKVAPSSSRSSRTSTSSSKSSSTTAERDDSREGATESSGAGTTGFDASNARKIKAAKKAAKARQTPPQLAPADAAAARAIARGPQQLYGRSIVPPASGLLTGTLPPVIIPLHRRPPPLVDPYAPLGVRSGSFLWFPALEVSGGYDSNPLRRQSGPAAGILNVAPELKVLSQWRRHELKAELRGSYLAYSRKFGDVTGGPAGTISTSGVPRSLDRPDFEGKVNGKLDTYGRSHADVEGRLTVGTDNPGSPNVLAGLERLPIFTRLGGSLGYTQNFNRLDVTLKSGIDRIDYQPSKLTDGSSSPNNDRNYNQYSVSLRGGYELRPGMTPFAEVLADQRRHDLSLDRNGLNRDSDAFTGRVGTTFELNRQLTGEISAGYLTRRYKDPTLRELSGLVADASLIWLASALTTVTFTAKSASDESVVADVSGVLRRDATLQVDHAFRQWLIGTVKGGVGLDEYQATGSGSSRQDQRFSVAAALVYKLSREWQLKGEIRKDWLQSNVTNADYTADTILIGMRWQR